MRVVNKLERISAKTASGQSSNTTKSVSKDGIYTVSIGQSQGEMLEIKIGSYTSAKTEPEPTISRIIPYIRGLFRLYCGYPFG